LKNVNDREFPKAVKHGPEGVGELVVVVLERVEVVVEPLVTQAKNERL
jgi:hypothetical protein